MSGSSESNEDLVAGRVNRANDQTTIWAENRYTTVVVVFVEVGAFRVPYSGNAIFKVEAVKDSEDEGEFRPPAPLNAIVGVGWSAEHNGLSGGIGVTGQGGPVGGLGVRGEGGENGTGVLGDAGGRAAAVVGLGGPNEGTGVFGLGSGGERLSRRGRRCLRPGWPDYRPEQGAAPARNGGDRCRRRRRQRRRVRPGRRGHN